MEWRREDPHEVSKGVGCHADALLEGNQLGGKEWGSGRRGGWDSAPWEGNTALRRGIVCEAESFGGVGELHTMCGVARGLGGWAGLGGFVCFDVFVVRDWTSFPLRDAGDGEVGTQG